jgi:hypothetical protein
VRREEQRRGGAKEGEGGGMLRGEDDEWWLDVWGVCVGGGGEGGEREMIGARG